MGALHQAWIGATLLLMISPPPTASQNTEHNLMFLKHLNSYVEHIKILTNTLRTNNPDAINIKGHYMLVSDLRVTKQHNYVFSVQLGNSSEMHRNIQFRKLKNDSDCDQDCVNFILEVCSSQPGCKLTRWPMLHTELLFLYGKLGREELNRSRQEQTITLIYSHYIPCADNSDSWGECAGDLAQ